MSTKRWICGRVLLEVGADQHPVREALDPHELRHALEVLGIADVLLRERHSAVRPLRQRVLLGSLLRRRPADVDLELGPHRLRVLSLLASPLAELVPQHRDLLVRGADGDDPVGVSAGPLRVHRTGGGHVDRDGLLRPGVEAGRLEREVVAVVLHDLAAEELRDDLDRLEHHRRADADLRPLAADHVLVQRLAGAEAEPEAPRVHRAEGRRRVGDHGGVVAEAGAGDGGAEGELRALSERAHERPREGRLPLLGRPGMEVLADLEARVESGGLGPLGPVEQVGRVELLEHAGVADLRHGDSVPAASG